MPRHLHFVLGVLACTALLLTTATSHAQTLYIADAGRNTVTALDAGTGSALPDFSNPSGLNFPEGIAISGDTLYVANYYAKSVSTYDALTGATLTSSLISTGSANPVGIALGDNILYVVNFSGNLTAYNALSGAPLAGFSSGLTSGQTYGLAVSSNTLYVIYNSSVETLNATTGAVINASFITGLTKPFNLIVSGNSLYLASIGGANTVTEYDASTGSLIPSFQSPSGLQSPTGLALVGNTLYIANNGNGDIGAYNASTGATINATYASGFGTPQFIAASAPEPSTWALLLAGAASLFVFLRKRSIR